MNNKQKTHKPKPGITLCIQIALYAFLLLCYIAFMLYYLTLKPGGEYANINIIYILTGFASGAMMMMAIFGITLWLFQREEKYLLYFALICLSTSIRFLVLEQSMLLTEIFTMLPKQYAAAINPVALGLQTCGIICFIHEFYATEKTKRHLPYIFIPLVIVYAIATVLTISHAYTILPARTLISLFTYIVAVYLIVIIIKSPNFRKNALSILFFTCVLTFFLSTVITAFFAENLPNMAITSFSVFIIAHIILLSERYSRTINENVMLGKLNLIKTNFLQDMSHEMKNPLNIIATGIDFTDRVLSKDNPDIITAREKLENLREETQRLGRMVSGMIKMVSMSDITEIRQRADFSELIKNSVETFLIANKNIHINIDMYIFVCYQKCLNTVFYKLGKICPLPYFSNVSH